MYLKLMLQGAVGAPGDKGETGSRGNKVHSFILTFSVYVPLCLMALEICDVQFFNNTCEAS